MRARALFFVGLALLGCGDDERPSTTDAPEATVDSKLKLLGARGPQADAAPQLSGCVEVGEDPDRTAFIVIDVEKYVLKPPAACRGLGACGAVRVTLTPTDGEATAITGVLRHIPVKFSQLPLGDYEVSVRLVNDNGSDAGSSACAPGPCESEFIRFASSCAGGTSPDGGANSDAGSSDAGSLPDGGSLSDAGILSDTGALPDAAIGSDAADSGQFTITDASVDAGSNGSRQVDAAPTAAAADAAL